jgi:D-3-phosphoglycerate dehydrogenase
MNPTVVLTDHGEILSLVARDLIEQSGARIVDAQRANPEDPVAAMRDADALLVIWYPMTAEVIGQLRRCKIILRLGVGVDNIDLQAEAARGIPVCNVPDYCTNEVADHAFALALTLARRLPTLEQCLRSGAWLPEMPPIPAFEDMTFAVAGFGRIGRAVIARARPFRFRLVAYDPYLPEETFARENVERTNREALLAEADILSLHIPLTSETRHFINADALSHMKSSAVLVNTSRGPHIDTVALAEALRQGTIAGAALDVFETEPLEPDHPLRTSPNTVLTPHYAWHSAKSGPKLHIMAAEEIVRALRNEPLQNCVNLRTSAIVTTTTTVSARG